MARLRVTASMRKQLMGYRDTRTGGLRRGGVMQVPRILSCDEWEALASGQQDALIAASYEDRARPEQAVATSVRPANANDDHNAANRAMGERRRQGGRPYLEAKEQEVRQVTPPRVDSYRVRGRGMVSR